MALWLLPRAVVASQSEAATARGSPSSPGDVAFVSKERVVFSKLIKDEDMCQQVLQDAKSFKFGDEDLQEGGALFIVSDGVKISLYNIL